MANRQARALVTSGWKRDALDQARERSPLRWQRAGCRLVKGRAVTGQVVSLSWRAFEVLGMIEGAIQAGTLMDTERLKAAGVVGASTLFALEAARDPEVFAALRGLHQTGGAQVVGEALRALAKRRRRPDRALVFPDLENIATLSIGDTVLVVGSGDVKVTRWAP